MTPRARRVRRAAFAAACGLLLSGCGSTGGSGFLPAAVANGPDQNAVRNVIVSYARALAVGDGLTLCALLDGPAEQQLAQLGGVGALTANAAPAQVCAQAIAQTSARLTDAERTALNTVVVKSVVVEGSVATVSDSELAAAGASTRSGTGGGSIVLVRQGSRWLISQIG
jgi:hypothetical protein